MSWLTLSIVALAGIVLGVAAMAGLRATVDYTNTNAYCSSCHAMDIVVSEYGHTRHHANPAGVQATCADCHVPRAFIPALIHKAESIRELIGVLRGTIDTPEKFEHERLPLARRVWAEMVATNSGNCRECHQLAAMAADSGRPAASSIHASLSVPGINCASCHGGLAHVLPPEMRSAQSVVPPSVARIAEDKALRARLKSMASKIAGFEAAVRTPIPQGPNPPGGTPHKGGALAPSSGPLHASGALYDHHAKAGLACSACHKENPPQIDPPTAVCLGCHGGTYEQLAEKTLTVEPNPHASHLGAQDCSSCHHSHRPSEVLCAKCHYFDLKVRE